MVNIDYDAASNDAVISAEADIPDPAWSEVRGAVERAYEIENTDARTVRVPWWNFLLLRQDLSYVFRKHSISATLTPSARSLLLESRKREKAYSRPHAQAFDESSLGRRLREVHFTRTLTNEQIRNVLFLLRYPAAATFSVPGAGKTTEALAYFFALRQEDTPLLVVAPKNAFAAWEEQLELCAPESGCTIARLQGGYEGVAAILATGPTIALITYQQLYRAPGTIQTSNISRALWLK